MEQPELLVVDERSFKIALGHDPRLRRGGGGAAKHRAATGSILSIPQKYFYVAMIFRWHWLEESGQRLHNVNRTHLVPAILASTTKKLGPLKRPGKLPGLSDTVNMLKWLVEAQSSSLMEEARLETKKNRMGVSQAIGFSRTCLVQACCEVVFLVKI